MGKVIVVGGGAAGMMAAVSAAESGHEVTLLEKNEKLGKKVYITGKGRCNLTNHCETEELLGAVCTNRKFLYSAFYGFTSEDAIRFFEASGMRTKTERGGRVFPVSDHSSDVIAALASRLKKAGVRVLLHTEVDRILTEGGGDGTQERSSDDAHMAAEQEERNSDSARMTDEEKMRSMDGTRVAAEEKVRSLDSICMAAEEKVRSSAGVRIAPDERAPKVSGVRLSDGSCMAADAVIVATGGLSYPSTGSTGDGYRFARELGHSVTELSPSLVPIETEGDLAARLQGLSLRNVEVAVFDGRKELYREFGEMLFTHYGVTGPLILTASSVVGRRLGKHPLQLRINLKPALSEEQLDARILREFEGAKNKQFKNALGSLYPSKLIPVMIECSGIPGEKPVHDISREERKNLVRLTQEFPLTLTALRDYNEAIVTSGGVSVREVNPTTMESRKVRGLHFAGEVLDLDAVTGGFNLQIAWSTGHAAGKGIAEDL